MESIPVCLLSDTALRALTRACACVALPPSLWHSSPPTTYTTRTVRHGVYSMVDGSAYPRRKWKSAAKLPVSSQVPLVAIFTGRAFTCRQSLSDAWCLTRCTTWWNVRHPLSSSALLEPCPQSFPALQTTMIWLTGVPVPVDSMLALMPIRSSSSFYYRRARR